MQEFDESPDAATFESAWILQDEEEQPNMHMTKTTNELCALAHSQERLNIRTYWIAAAVVACFVGGFLYNVFSIAQSWVRLGQAWMLGVVCYLFGAALQRGPMRIGTNEPCAQFLEREFEGKRRGLLAIRRNLLLFIPGIAATYWGGGPTATAKSLGLVPSSWQFQFVTGPWPLIIIGVVVMVVWFAFGKAAEKAWRDHQDIRRNIES